MQESCWPSPCMYALLAEGRSQRHACNMLATAEPAARYRIPRRSSICHRSGALLQGCICQHHHLMVVYVVMQPAVTQARDAARGSLRPHGVYVGCIKTAPWTRMQHHHPHVSPEIQAAVMFCCVEDATWSNLSTEMQHTRLAIGALAMLNERQLVEHVVAASCEKWCRLVVQLAHVTPTFLQAAGLLHTLGTCWTSDVVFAWRECVLFCTIRVLLVVQQR